MERQKLIFDELIDQRLSQVIHLTIKKKQKYSFFSLKGFQMIIEIPDHIRKLMVDRIRRMNYKETDCNRLLTIGRIYHTLSLVKEENQTTQDAVVICVQQFKPQ